MRRAGKLFDRVASFEALCAAARRAARGKRLSLDACAFLFDLETEVLRLQRELLSGTYHPGPFRTFRIRDPKPRTISAAPFRDRVAHHALCAAIEPVLERYAIFHSYACRTAKGTTAAVAHAQRLSRRSPWFLKLDVEHFFETIHHAVLTSALHRRLKDERVLALIGTVLAAGSPGSSQGRGLPIGNLTSQHFANFYLGAYDHWMIEEQRPHGYCRYMDDMLVFVGSEDEARAIADRSARFLEDELRVRAKQSATLVQRTCNGVPFLGMRIWPGTIRLDAMRARRFRRRFRALEGAVVGAAGWAREEATLRSAASLVGWAQQADTLGFRRSFFARLAGCGMLAHGERRHRARTG